MVGSSDTAAEDAAEAEAREEEVLRGRNKETEEKLGRRAEVWRAVAAVRLIMAAIFAFLLSLHSCCLTHSQLRASPRLLLLQQKSKNVIAGSTPDLYNTHHLIIHLLSTSSRSLRAVFPLSGLKFWRNKRNCSQQQWQKQQRPHNQQ